MTERLISLQILRGIAAMLVVAGHGTTFRGAPAAAELFFVISGFVMMYATQKGLDQYFIKRLIRLVPLYWIANITFAVLLRPANFTVPLFLQSLFFLNAIPLLTVGWTLNREVLFYVIFWVCAKLDLERRGVLAILACLLWYAAAVMRRFWGGYIDPFPLMQPALILGILAFYCYRALRTKPLRRGHKVLLWSLVAACALFVRSRYADSLLWDISAGTWALRRAAVLGIPVFLVFLSMLLLVRDDRSRPVKALVYVGNISYSLYLWHIIVEELIVKLFGAFGYVITPPSTFPFMLLNLSVSLAASSLSYRYLEQPVTSYLKGKLLKKKGSPPAKAPEPDRAPRSVDTRSDTMSYNILSRYRPELMGVAILWVMLFHSYDLDMGHSALDWLRAAGFGGVDIFILLSSMGLVMSLGRREQDYSAFMARRAKRILPAYYLVMIPYTLFLIRYKDALWSALLWNASLLYYWVRPAGAFNWYVAGSMTFYAVTPACFRRLRRSRRRELVTAAGVLAGLAVSQLLIREDLWWNMLDIVYRIPIFFLGLLMGSYVLEDRKLGGKDLLFWCVWSGLGVIYALCLGKGPHPGYRPLCYLFLFTTVPACLLLCWCFQHLPLGPVRKFFHLLGTHSLEIYLLNVSVFSEVGLLRQFIPSVGPGNRIYYLYSYIINIALALLLRHIVEQLRLIGQKVRGTA